MADTSSLLPVIVGGLLTMGGGLVTGGVTLIVNVIQSKAEKKKRRAEKFEELVIAVYEFDDWLRKCENVTAFGKEETIEVSPLAKVEAISAVHFPVFLKKISEVVEAARKYQFWMTQAGVKRLENKIKEVNDGLVEVYNPYLQRRDELLDELKKYGSENFR